MTRFRSASVLTAMVFLAGCGDGFTYVAVKGKVTLKNEPITTGEVVFVPEEGNPIGVNATGKIKPDGTFVLTTENRSGVPTGSYIACVRPQMRRLKGQDPPPRVFSDKYISANESPLKIQVVANPAPGAYDLLLTED